MDREYTNRQKQLIRKKRKQQKRKRVFVLFCFVLCCAAVLGVVFKAPFFNIEKVTVKGVKILTKEAVLQKADIQVGTNIFGVSMSGIREKIMEIPYVSGADVKRVFPNEITVTVTECVPRAYVKSDKTFFLIDSKGKILEKSEKDDKYNVITIKGLKLENPKIGSDILNENDVRTEYCTKILGILEKLGLAEKTKSLDFTQITGIKLNYDDRVYVNCGSYDNSEDFEYKLSMCAHLINEEISPYEKLEVDLTMDKTIVRPYEDPEEKKKRLEEERKQKEEAEESENEPKEDNI